MLFSRNRASSLGALQSSPEQDYDRHRAERGEARWGLAGGAEGSRSLIFVLRLKRIRESEDEDEVEDD